MHYLCRSYGRNYNKEERFDAKTIEELKHHYTEILRLLGGDPAREGLPEAPERVAKAMSFLTKGYDESRWKSSARRRSAKITSRWCW